ncbi:Subunit of heteropentameric Replication factor C (RF-C) [Steccherinum ochraceum]|uniref:Replication factor C subunit 3 n=1 Tax=Steccherinum ochraceum TaxID=92696 RepID=A0A4R0RS52_9APHY|nr:Subunit of heteropentameric Replication factor C (RF-C) [Steccherinum ochraceum]
MDSDEDMHMEQDDAPISWPTSKGKGKEKAVDPPAEVLEGDNLPWVEKYRPVTLDDVVSHKEITGTIEKFIEKNRLPHLLFYGPPGTGKTSTILAVARRIYGDSYRKQILELNASDDRGIDVVRDQIKNFAETRTLFSKGYKLIILDEADMMTTAAQSALRRVIEQYTKNVRFCIICNYVNKIIPAIQSRCTRFRFSPLPVKEVEKRVNTVIEAEGVKLTEDGRQALLKLSKGDMRRALNVLQACHAAYDLTGETEVYNCTGNPHPQDIATIVNSMFSDEFTTSYRMIQTMKTERGLALQDLINGAYEYIEDIEFKSHARIYLLDFLATTEHRLSTGGNEKIQLTALLGAFKNAVELSQKS